VKACPACHRLFSDEDGFCPVDGGKLSNYADVPAKTAPDDPILGNTLGAHYEIRRIVADGGMGRVYEARDAKTDRRVAVKVLHPEVARDQVAVERFKREFEISKDLPHDHIVDVLDFQEPSPKQFVMAMEFLDGEELRTVLKREKTIDPARILRMISQVAIGLDEAHRRQFVHRDLKPDNIFLCGSRAGDVVKILDFGSVRINKNRQMSKLTSLGTTIGSPYYMSPEQAQGAENLDHRADVFALGAIAYECLTGQVPFTGANGPAILLAILTKNPPPVSTRATAAWKLPPALDDVIDDALAKKPETRTPTVGAFADAFGKAFGLDGTHVDWAKMPTLEIGEAMAAARAAGKVGEAVADPFAAAAGAGANVSADPFAIGAEARVGGDLATNAMRPVPPGAPAPPPPPPPPNALNAGMAMDQAFATAGGQLEPAGVPQKSMGLVIAALVVALLIVIAIIVVIVKQ
jgi:tRNA A-37 threonylcarbamoyl transferase component Bud32